MSQSLNCHISDGLCIERWRDVELRTLEFIVNEKTFRENYNCFYMYAKQLADLLKSSKGKQGRKGKDFIITKKLDFKAYLDIKYKKYNGKAFIGIDEQHSKYEIWEGISYSLVLTKDENEKVEPLRRFHFDVITKDTNINNAHPVYHLQYGGNLPTYLHNIIHEDYYNEKIHNWLSNPRIFFPPFSLGLIINMLFIEFPDSTNKKIIETPEWIHLIRYIEEELLEPYFLQLSDFIDRRRRSGNRKELIINDFLYFKNS